MLIGSCVHELFEHINWIDDPDFDQSSIQNQLTPGMYPESVINNSINVVEHALKSEAIRSLLQRSDFNKEHSSANDLIVHHERPFALRMTVNNEERFIQGRFDRLVIARNDQAIVHIQLVDYKTDADARDLDDDTLMERHGLQIKLYCQALSELYKISPSDVECVLVFTARPGIIKL
jgi:hypothetical protein